MSARTWVCLVLLVCVPFFFVGSYLVYDWFGWRGHAESSTDVVLQLVCETPNVRVGQAPKVKVFVVNRGDTKVMLVDAGDGSTFSWRTPTIEWSPRAKVQGARCGNINSIQSKEIFMLQPGESRRLSGWVGSPRLENPGRYEVSVQYVNDPDQIWRGELLGVHSAWAMRRVRNSTKVVAVSNTVEIVVEK